MSRATVAFLLISFILSFEYNYICSIEKIRTEKKCPYIEATYSEMNQDIINGDISKFFSTNNGSIKIGKCFNKMADS